VVVFHGVVYHNHLLLLLQLELMADVVHNGYTYLFWCERSTHIQIDSPSFLGGKTIGAHHNVTSVTGAMIFCYCRRSTSALECGIVI